MDDLFLPTPEIDDRLIPTLNENLPDVIAEVIADLPVSDEIEDLEDFNTILSSIANDLFTCSICFDQLPSENELNKHLSTHIAPHNHKGFKCLLPGCDEAYRFQHDLERHLLQDHFDNSKPPFTCDICKRQFGWKCNLVAHYRMHTGDTRFKCNDCTAVFSRYSSLVRHMRDHNAKKPYACDMCDKRFSRTEHLKTHFLVHNGERPFVCKHEGCDKGFNTISHLKRHARSHTGEKRFACKVCKKGFTGSQNMKKHEEKCTKKKLTGDKK